MIKLILSLSLSQLQASFGIWNLTVKYIDDAGDSVNMDSQGMLPHSIMLLQIFPDT